MFTFLYSYILLLACLAGDPASTHTTDTTDFLWFSDFDAVALYADDGDWDEPAACTGSAYAALTSSKCPNPSKCAGVSNYCYLTHPVTDATGYKDLGLQFDVIVWGMDAERYDDQCVVLFSTDNGYTWTSAYSVTAANNAHPIEKQMVWFGSSADASSEIVVRFQGKGKATTAHCLFDNVGLFGTLIADDGTNGRGDESTPGPTPRLPPWLNSDAPTATSVSPTMRPSQTPTATPSTGTGTETPTMQPSANPTVNPSVSASLANVDDEGGHSTAEADVDTNTNVGENGNQPRSNNGGAIAAITTQSGDSTIPGINNLVMIIVLVFMCGLCCVLVLLVVYFVQLRRLRQTTQRSFEAKVATILANNAQSMQNNAKHNKENANANANAKAQTKKQKNASPQQQPQKHKHKEKEKQRSSLFSGIKFGKQLSTVEADFAENMQHSSQNSSVNSKMAFKYEDDEEEDADHHHDHEIAIASPATATDYALPQHWNNSSNHHHHTHHTGHSGYGIDNGHAVEGDGTVQVVYADDDGNNAGPVKADNNNRNRNNDDDDIVDIQMSKYVQTVGSFNRNDLRNHNNNHDVDIIVISGNDKVLDLMTAEKRNKAFKFDVGHGNQNDIDESESESDDNDVIDYHLNSFVNTAGNSNQVRISVAAS